MGRMDGKVVLITGAARGLGRSHALTLAREGADILTLDCPDLPVIPYPLATMDQLAETVADIEALGRRVIAIEGDVRRQEDLDRLVARGLEELGHIAAGHLVMPGLNGAEMAAAAEEQGVHA